MDPYFPCKCGHFFENHWASGLRCDICWYESGDILIKVCSKFEPDNLKYLEILSGE